MPTYPGLDTLNMTNDASQLLVYANTLTGGILGPLILGAFFLIILLGSIFMQVRFSGRDRFEVAFASASFITFGLSVLMSLTPGLLNPNFLFVNIGLCVISIFWLYFGSQP